MFQRINHGIPVPPKVWARATDVLVAYRVAGAAWDKAGKPKTGLVYDEYCKVEAEYNQMADAIWFASWTDEQREEWGRIHENTER